MTQILFEVVIIFLLLIANGVFAMTEIAVVSASRARLKRWAEKGDARARSALEIAQAPSLFFSTVQVGITLVGVLAGAFGGATLAEVLSGTLADAPVVGPYSEAIGLAIVVLGITYFSLVVGELAPKRVALANPEGIARAMAKPMMRLAMIAGPIVRFLGFSTDIVVRVFGLRTERQTVITEEEVKHIMLEGVQAGVFHKAEPQMVERVLGLDKLLVREIMTPRAKVTFLNGDDSHEVTWQKIVVSAHSNFPVFQGNRDNVVGVVAVKSMYANLAAGAPVRLLDLAVPSLLVPDTQTVLQLLDSFKRSGKHFAVVADEFGSAAGVVTLVDVLEAIAGDIPGQEERLKPRVRKRPDGSWLADGTVELSEVESAIPGMRFPDKTERPYDTLAGFILAKLGRVPEQGESVEWLNHRFEVIDVDRARIVTVLITPTHAQA